MKKLLAILFLGAVSLFAQPTNYEGSGTAGDPWQISTVAQFDSLRYNSETDGAGTTWWWIITEDIDFTGVTNWVPIGNSVSSAVWNGSIDGNGKRLKNLTIDSTVSGANAHYLGLFGNLGAGDAGELDDNIKIIHNFCIEDFNFTFRGAVDNQHFYIGILAGLSAGNVGTTDIEIDSITIITSYLTVDMASADPNAATVRIGGLSGGLYRAHHLYVDVDLDITLGANSLNAQEGIGGVTGFTGSSMKYVAYVGNIDALSTASTPVGGIVGRHDPGATTDSLTENYVKSGYIMGAYYVGGIIGFNQTEPNTRVRNTYIQIDSLHGLNTGSDVDGYIIGYSEATGPVFTSVYADTQNVDFGFEWGGAAYDTWERTLKSDTEAGSVGADSARTTAQMIDQATYWTFDFTNIWKISAAENEGYPELQWVVLYPPGPTLTYPQAAGLVFRADSIITVAWTAGLDTPLTSSALYYSINAGSDWTLITALSALDVSYQWTIPDVPTVQGRVKITEVGNLVTQSDSSAENYTVLAQSSMDIYYPISKTGQTITEGDTLHIDIESSFITNIWLYWSNNQTDYYFIDSTAVDTVNMQYLDSTTYVWTFDALVSGPEVWVKLEEQVDTALYVFTRDMVDLGIRYPVGLNVCQNDSGGTLIEFFVHYDPSCGWTQPSHTYYNSVIGDLGESYSVIGEAFPHPYTGAAFPLTAPVNIVTGSDTAAVNLNDFYTQYGDSVVYLNRRYYVDDQKLKMNDLVNTEIVGVVVSDLSEMYASAYPWVEGEEVLQVYHVQHSKISGLVHDNATVWETLNDAWFSPKILISASTTYPANTITVDAIGAPAQGNPATEEEKVLTGASFVRYHFRGIHPKINREN